MKTTARVLSAMLLSVLVYGCTPAATGTPDAGPLPFDAGPDPVDAGPVDAGALDAGAADAGPVDAGTDPDAGPIDAGTDPDAGQPSDAGFTPDAGDVPDAGSTPDAGDVPDSGTTVTDAGTDPDAGGTVVDAGPSSIDTPTITPGTGVYSSTQSVVLATTTPGAELHYTVDGSTPTSASALYSAPLAVANSTILKAVATLAGLADSSVATATFTINLPPTDLLINEVGNAVYNNQASAIEIYNPTSASKDLSQYQLRTTARAYVRGSSSFAYAGIRIFSLPALTIPAQGYVVIRGKMNTDYVSGGSTVYLDDGAANIPYYPSNGFVELLSAGGATVDFVRFGSDTTSPTSTSFDFMGAAQAFIADVAHLGYSINRDVGSTNSRTAADWTMRAWMTLGGPNDVTTDSASDGDGIPDSAKVPGSTFAGLPLYAWGARPGQKDIFIHIDYMDPTQDPTGSAADAAIPPDRRALAKAVAVFARKGYAVHFDVGDFFSPTAGDTANYNLDGRSHKVPWAQSVTLGVSSGFANAYEYKVTYMPVAKGRAFFYMLFGSSQQATGDSGSSGLANLPGSTSIVTLGRWNLAAGSNRLANSQGATIVHEFGHNLGLKHGGDENLNYKPNYFSIMNYMYQLAGLPTIGVDDDTRYYSQANGQQGTLTYNLDRTYWKNWAASPNADPSLFSIDYSDGSGTDIVLASVNDTTGIGRPGSVGIDFDDRGSSTATGYSFDVSNYLTGTPSRGTRLHDHDDWSKISSVFQRTFQGYNQLAGYPFQPSDVVPVVNARDIFERPSTELSGPCAAQ